MSAKPVGESPADDKFGRIGAAARGITESARRARPSLPSRFRAFPYTAPSTPTTVEALPKESNLELDYDTDWARGPGSRLARRVIQNGFVAPTVRVLTDPTIQGLDRLEGLKGPVVFVANHESHLDIGLLLTSIPERFRRRAFVAAASDYFFDARWKAALSALSLNAVPIERQKVSRRSSDQILALLRADWNLVIFPEGGRSNDGWGSEFKPGAAFLASRRGCPIVPVHLEGTGDVLPKGASRPKRHRCTVTFGFPIHPGDDDPRDISKRLEAAVTVLADECRTDFWTARQRAASNTSTSLRGPDGAASWRRTWERTAAEAKKQLRDERGKRDWP